MVDDHFGHCAYYTIYHLNDDNKVVIQERLDSPQGCGCKSNIASLLREMGVTLMLAGNMGEGAFRKLSEQQIEVSEGATERWRTCWRNIWRASCRTPKRRATIMIAMGRTT